MSRREGEWVICEECQGMGKLMKTCETCGGTGVVDGKPCPNHYCEYGTDKRPCPANCVNGWLPRMPDQRGY